MYINGVLKQIFYYLCPIAYNIEVFFLYLCTFYSPLVYYFYIIIRRQGSVACALCGALAAGEPGGQGLDRLQRTAGDGVLRCVVKAQHHVTVRVTLTGADCILAMAMLSVRLFREVFSQVSLFSRLSICSAEYLLTSALVNADAVSFKSLLRTLTVRSWRPGLCSQCYIPNS